MNYTFFGRRHREYGIFSERQQTSEQPTNIRVETNTTKIFRAARDVFEAFEQYCR